MNKKAFIKNVIRTTLAEVYEKQASAAQMLSTSLATPPKRVMYEGDYLPAERSSYVDPSSKALYKAITKLVDAKDDEHTTQWMRTAGDKYEDQHNILMEVDNDGTVAINNSKEEGPWHLKNQSKRKMVKLLKALQAGDLKTLNRQSWSPGRGYTPKPLVTNKA